MSDRISDALPDDTTDLLPCIRRQLQLWGAAGIERNVTTADVVRLLVEEGRPLVVRAVLGEKARQTPAERELSARVFSGRSGASVDGARCWTASMPSERADSRTAQELRDELRNHGLPWCDGEAAGAQQQFPTLRMG